MSDVLTHSPVYFSFSHPLVLCLPTTYNETSITAVIRNPAWIYAYWDISVADVETIIQNNHFSSLMLKLCFFSRDNTEKPAEIFECHYERNHEVCEFVFDKY